jgi:hypothetical protein
MLELDYHSRTPEEAKQEPALKNLDLALQGEYRGSVKVKAFSDGAAEERAEMQLALLEQQEKPDLAKLLMATAELAAVQETIRKRSFGEDGREYADLVHHEYSSHKLDYLNQEGLLRGMNESGGRIFLNNPELRLHSARVMLKDLQKINARLPKK